MWKSSFEGLEQAVVTEFLITGGRALMYPVYRGTYERQALEAEKPTGPIGWRDQNIRWSKEVRRSVDYLETREDIDKQRIGYYGVSWGSNLGPVNVAVEQRLRLAVLSMGSFLGSGLPPAIDALNFLPRVRVPVLLIGGEQDIFFPIEESQKPFFDLLGTPAEHKQHKVYPGGHGLYGQFTRQIHGDVLGFLDRYFGPVVRE